MKKIADAFGGHYATVSRVVKRLEGMRDYKTLSSPFFSSGPRLQTSLAEHMRKCGITPNPADPTAPPHSIPGLPHAASPLSRVARLAISCANFLKSSWHCRTLV